MDSNTNDLLLNEPQPQPTINKKETPEEYKARQQKKREILEEHERKMKQRDEERKIRENSEEFRRNLENKRNKINLYICLIRIFCCPCIVVSKLF